MKYMGSKRRLAKNLLPIILKHRKPNQWYVEPFVGGGNMIEHVDGLRIGADSHYYLIKMFKALQNGWEPPKLITEDEYNNIKNNKDDYSPELVGFVGFGLSFGAKFFGGYRRDKAGQKGDIDNMKKQTIRCYNNAIKQQPKIKSVSFFNCSYNELDIPPNSIIYCDPPYANTTKYSTSKGFNHDEFWQWCRDMTDKGHDVFISEYNAPDDFACIWKKELVSGLDHKNHSKKGVEKLFMYSKHPNIESYMS